MEKIVEFLNTLPSVAIELITQPETYIQLSIIVGIYLSAYFIAKRVKQYFASINNKLVIKNHPIQNFLFKIGNLIFPLLVLLFLKIAAELSHSLLSQNWLVLSALIIAVLLLFNNFIDSVFESKLAARFIKWFGSTLILLHFIGALSSIIAILESISITLGNIEFSLYGVFRVAIFGSLLFWLGRASNATGKNFIKRQEQLDFRTKEVASKLLEVVIFVTVSLLILQVMGVNLTALAVFGGALGVGLGFGLQAIASNFISGIIILLDRSVSIDDYIELDDGRTGFVRELNMRSTTLETYDGKDIMVPNEKFIVESFTNWTHKNKLQRYRVDFSVAYDSDVRKLVEIIKEVVSEHPQVLSGDDVAFEERPDCEIAGFGESGINMFVEFWMEGIDDGKNRVGGDLLLIILEALQQNGYEIPFPQREVRILEK